MKWKRAELEILFQNRNLGASGIQIKLAEAGYLRSVVSIGDKAKRMKIPIKRVDPKHWQPYEIAILKDCYKYGASYCQKKLKDAGSKRSLRRVYEKAHNLGLKVDNKNVQSQRLATARRNGSLKKKADMQRRPDGFIGHKKGSLIIYQGGRKLSYYRYLWEQYNGVPIPANHRIVRSSITDMQNPDASKLAIEHFTDALSRETKPRRVLSKEQLSAKAYKGHETRRRKRIKQEGGIVAAYINGVAI